MLFKMPIFQKKNKANNEILSDFQTSATLSDHQFPLNKELNVSCNYFNSSKLAKPQAVACKAIDLPKENFILKQRNLKSNGDIGLTSSQNHSLNEENKYKKSSKKERLSLPSIIFKTPNFTRHTFETTEYDEEKMFINDESYFYSSSLNNQPDLNTYYNFNKNKIQEICDFRLPKQPRLFGSKSKNSLTDDSLIWSKYKRTINKVYELRKTKEKSEMTAIA